MKRILLLLCFTLIALSVNAQRTSVSVKVQGNATAKKLVKLLRDPGANIILVRHAEKEPAGKDPALSPEGQKRAQRLSLLLNGVELDRILVTQYLRTQQTAVPVATDKNISAEIYEAAKSAAVLCDLATTEVRILVVGHSNTLHLMLNALTGESRFTEISESDYSNLYVVNLRNGRVKVHHLRY